MVTVPANATLLRSVRLAGFKTTAERDAFGSSDGLQVGDFALVRGLGLFVCTSMLAHSSTWVAAWPPGSALQFPGIYAITDYGAVAGPNPVTNTDALGDAIDAASSAGGGIVYIPPGAYQITGGELGGQQNVWIVGAGWQSRLDVVGAGSVGLVVGDTTGTIDSDADVRLAHFELRGVPGTSHGIVLHRMREISLENLRIQDFGGDGIRADRCRGSQYRDLSVSGCAQGYHALPGSGGATNEFMEFGRCRFNGNSGRGFYVEGSASGLTVDSCEFSGNGGNALQIDAGSDEHSNGVILSGLYFEDNDAANISLGEDAGTRFVGAVHLHGCNIFPGTVSAAVNSVALDRARNVLIEACRFASSDVTVTANTTHVAWFSNRMASSTGIFGSVEPLHYLHDSISNDLCYGISVNGVGPRRHRLGSTYVNTAISLTSNLRLTSDSAGVQDDNTVGSAGLILGDGYGKLVSCDAGGGSSLTEVMDWRDTATTLRGRVPTSGNLDGGNLVLSGGNSSGTGSPGSILASGGNAQSGNVAGGAITITGGNGSGNEAGGDILVRGGVAGTTGRGGNVDIIGRAGGSTSGDGGDVSITAGNAVSGTAGDVTIASGSATTGTSGDIHLTPGRALRIAGQMTQENIITTGDINTPTHDWNPTGLVTANVIRVTCNGNVTLTGLESSGVLPWTIKTIVNVDAVDSLTLQHDNGADSTAANRFLLSNNANVIVRPQAAVRVFYDSVSSRWRVG